MEGGAYGRRDEEIVMEQAREKSRMQQKSGKQRGRVERRGGRGQRGIKR